MTPPFSSPFALLGTTLAARLSLQSNRRLLRTFESVDLSWELLLATANQQECTPLWYFRLKQHDLLHYLPADLVDYLRQISNANSARNAKIQDEIIRIGTLFEERDIELLLLKGAATLFDDLYGSSAARMMRDVDLLLPDEKADEARQVLLGNGYVEERDERLSIHGLQVESRHPHLPPLMHPDRKIPIELHYRVIYGAAGYAFTPEMVWSESTRQASNGIPLQWLNPTHRLLHNVLHATLQHREFIRSEILLSQLAEFAAIYVKYRDAIDERWFWRFVCAKGFKTEATAYAELAQKLMGLEISIPPNRFGRFHAIRIEKGSQQYVGPPAPIAPKNSRREKIWPYLLMAYYYCKVPMWIWRNVCCVNENASGLAKLAICLRGLFRRRSWQLVKFH